MDKKLYFEETTDLLFKNASLFSFGGKTVIIAVDGRCASGKTTLAREFEEKFKCNVFHMDDFFLPPEMRTAQRLETPGGNVDYERFENEVLCRISSGEGVIYRAYDCGENRINDGVFIKPEKINIVEGSYSCHPSLWNYYTLRVFLDISPEKQKMRISSRNPEMAGMFFGKWIPLEEKYFSAFDIKNRCDLVFGEG